ncbi:hypothetical protein BDR22DRAFT_825096 [Usnea florida]
MYHVCEAIKQAAKTRSRSQGSNEPHKYTKDYPECFLTQKVGQGACCLIVLAVVLQVMSYLEWGISVLNPHQIHTSVLPTPCFQASPSPCRQAPKQASKCMQTNSQSKLPDHCLQHSQIYDGGDPNDTNNADDAHDTDSRNDAKDADDTDGVDDGNDAGGEDAADGIFRAYGAYEVWKTHTTWSTTVPPEPPPKWGFLSHQV